MRPGNGRPSTSAVEGSLSTASTRVGGGRRMREFGVEEVERQQAERAQASARLQAASTTRMLPAVDPIPVDRFATAARGAHAARDTKGDAA